MTLVALWDKAVPILAVLAAGGVGFSLGRGWERVEWLAGRRGATCDHDPNCSAVRGSR